MLRPKPQSQAHYACMPTIVYVHELSRCQAKLRFSELACLQVLQAMQRSQVSDLFAAIRRHKLSHCAWMSHVMGSAGQTGVCSIHTRMTAMSVQHLCHSLSTLPVPVTSIAFFVQFLSPTPQHSLLLITSCSACAVHLASDPFDSGA